MQSSWLTEVFGTEHPVIGMVHLQALPSSPRYDASGGVEKILEGALKDLIALQDGGVDAVMFCNEHDRPYLFKVDTVVPVTMARIIGELKPRIRVPFGTDLLWDPFAALAVAKATGASFVREVITGVYDSDMGLWNPSAGDVLRYRRQIGADNVKLLFNINGEFASYVGKRTVEEVAKSVIFSSIPDAICVSGSLTGSEVAGSMLQRVREAVGGFPIFANTGVRKENIAEQFRWANGAVVGTSLKVDGNTWNPVDPVRVAELMAAARAARGEG